jgi:hypothetical protein
MIILFPQAIADSTSHTIWNGGVLPNPNGCWDWVGWYGSNADQVGGTCLPTALATLWAMLTYKFRF